tara:strand:- start:2624 stop:3394 length:771 start_codon:yes stop_codon:yes gene_type:complete
MTFLKFTRLPENDRVDSYAMENTTRNLKAAVHIPRTLDGNKHLDTMALTSTLKDFTNKSAVLLEPHSESGWKTAAPEKLKPIMAETKALQKTAIARSKELEKRKVDLLKSDVDPAHARELRAWLRTQKPAAAIQKMLKDPEAALAALENPVGIPGLDDTNLMREVERAAMLHNMAKGYKAEGYDSHRTPSIDDPLAHGVDPSRLNSIAKEGLANFEASLSDVDAVRGVITQAVNYIAVAGDMSGHDAFHAVGLDKS